MRDVQTVEKPCFAIKQDTVFRQSADTAEPCPYSNVVNLMGRYATGAYPTREHFSLSVVMDWRLSQ